MWFFSYRHIYHVSLNHWPLVRSTKLYTPRVVAEFIKVIDDAYSRVKVACQWGLTAPRLRRQLRDMYFSERAGCGSGRDIAHHAVIQRSASEVSTSLASRLRGGPTRRQPSRDVTIHDMATCWCPKQHAIASTRWRAHAMRLPRRDVQHRGSIVA